MQDDAITGILYVAFGLVALVTLGKHDVPNIRQHPDNSAVRVAVALNAPDDGPTQADGTYPAILAYNEVGDYIGWSDWQHRPHIKSGGFHDVIIEQQKGPGQQATYLQLFAGTDAVCIAYISQTWADGTTRGWLGDMGRACGRPYYYSHIFVGNDGHVPGELVPRVSNKAHYHRDTRIQQLTSNLFLRLHMDGRRPQRRPRP